MPAVVTSRVGSHDVANHVFAAVLASHEMLGCASERASRAWSKAQLVWRGMPHRQTAIVTTAGLCVKRGRAEGFEAFCCHERLRNR